MDDLSGSSANNRLLDSFASPDLDDYDYEDDDENQLKHMNNPTGVSSISGADTSPVTGSGDDRLDHEFVPISAIQERLHGPSEPSGTQEMNNDIYNNIDSIDRDTINDNSNSNNSSSSSEGQTDLELQAPLGRLTTRTRILNVIHHLVPIKQTYDRINNGLTTGRMQPNTPGRFIGLGTDGVFRNLMAKPDTEATRQEQETNPPSYEEAAADATPEYWELTVILPLYEDEVFVEGLPVGNIANFVWNGLVTVAFQFIGFVLCYLLHTSHAAKHGSRAGLGITFIFYGWGMVPSNFGHADKVPLKYEPLDPNVFDVDKSLTVPVDHLDTYNSGIFQQHADDPSAGSVANSTPYISYGIIAFGLFIIIKSVVDYYRVKQMEKVILSPPNRAPPVVTSTTENVNNIDEAEETRDIE